MMTTGAAAETIPVQVDGKQMIATTYAASAMIETATTQT